MAENTEEQPKNYRELEQLREQVCLSQNRLQELTYHDNHYVQKLVSLNSEAKNLINQDLIAEALVYLAEAERVLQYGASCGKTIDRNIIIATLHNEACCYYKEGQLITAAKYIEAVIFNLKSNIASANSTPSNSSKKTTKKTDEFLFAPVQKKIELIHYHLKFCTISSQAKRRVTALEAGKKVIQIGRGLFTDLRQDNPKITPCDSNNQQMELADLKGLIRSIRMFKEQVHVDRVSDYLKVARAHTRRWNQQKMVRKISYTLQRHVSNYSISEVIEMVPMDYIADEDNYYHNFLSTKMVMRQILHFSMGYFTISTEYRLMAQELYRNSQQKYSSEEYLKANIYHLLAITFLADHVNCDLLFMKQIISSYEHHYKQQLTSQLELSPVEELAEQILYQPVKTDKSKFKQSLADKINKLSFKDKDRKKEKMIKCEYEESYTYQSKTGNNHTGNNYNDSRAEYKTKSRSNSKRPVKGLTSSKKLTNSHKNSQAVLKTSKMLNVNSNRDRSVSSGRKPVVRKRSVSKDSQGVMTFGNQSQKLLQKVQTKQKRRTNDEYQLGNFKVKSGRKRINSASSAQHSVSCRSRQQNINRAKQRLSKEQSVKKSLKGKSDRKKSNKASKRELLDRYYL